MKMKTWLLFTLMLTGFAWAQNGQVKHPRVAEVEEKLRDEAARYFTRRFPNQPFFIRVEVSPLRRDMVANGRMESLPYFDYESEESVDEWDDPKTPLAFLRHRVTKVVMEVDVPEKFTDAQLAEIKDEVGIYLKLLPFRDDVRVTRKFKQDAPPLIPNHYYPLLAGGLLCALLAGLLVRSGFAKIRAPGTAAVAAAPMAAPASAPPRERSSAPTKGSTAVSGDVTFHDPIKTIDIVHLKLEQIEKSGTFPNLNDLMSLHSAGEKFPERLGALLYEMPVDWQRRLFPLGHGQAWLEAFCHPGQIDHECLLLLDRIGKERNRQGTSAECEELLMQLWRMGQKASVFFKKIPQDHAFALLHMLPKSFALGVAKRTFPGAWGRLLENHAEGPVISDVILHEYRQQALMLEPYYEWKLLEGYRKDRELLKYLDTVSIDDEKDVYETLPEDSFVFRVRPPFYRVFAQEGEAWKNLVSSYPLDKWALVVMNSSRQYIRQVLEVLDDKQKVMFSQYLKQLDGGFAPEEQTEWRHIMARAVYVEKTPPMPPEDESSQEGDHAQSA